MNPNTALNLTDTVELLATITASGAPPTGTVAFVANETTIGTAAVDTSGPTPIAAIFVSAALIAGGNGTVTAIYSGDSVYNGSQASARFALNVPSGAAFVVPFVIPNPVYETAAFANWEFTVGLAEKGGVATSITAFTIDTNNDLSLLGPNPKLAANGTLAANIASTGLKPPQNRVVTFSGTDANGIKWTQQLTVPFLAPLGTQIAPGISLTSPTTTVQQNPQADPSCQWSLPVSVQETGGYPISLDRLQRRQHQPHVANSSHLRHYPAGAIRRAARDCLLQRDYAARGQKRPDFRDYQSAHHGHRDTSDLLYRTFHGPCRHVYARAIRFPGQRFRQHHRLAAVEPHRRRAAVHYFRFARQPHVRVAHRDARHRQRFQPRQHSGFRRGPVSRRL